jgi:OPA family glycerol-3-phosphate transporter-like MFS transporter
MFHIQHRTGQQPSTGNIRSIRKSENFWFISICCWGVYVLAYLGRINLSISLPYLNTLHGYSKISTGLIASGFFFAYAAGQFINGILGDHFNPRFFIGIGLILSGVSNVLFAHANNFWLMFCCWTLNGYFQSMFWGPLVRIISHITPPNQLKKTTQFLCSSMIIGYFFSYTLIGKLTISFGWMAAFYVPGFLLIIISILWIWFLRNYTDKGLVHKTVHGPSAYFHSPSGTVSFFIETKLWLIALVCILHGSIKEGLILWGPSLLMEARTISLEKALFFMTLTPFMNLIGLVAGGIVYKAFKYQEKHTIIFFLFAVILAIIILNISINYLSTLMTAAIAILFASLFVVNNMLVMYIPLNFHANHRVSTAAGFLDSAIYIGAACSSPLSGFIADRFGWFNVMNVWIMTGVVAIVLAMFSYNYKTPRFKAVEKIVGEK